MTEKRLWMLLKAICLVFVVALIVLLINICSLSPGERRDAALYQAIERSDLVAVTQLLREHADPNVRAPVSFSWALGRQPAAGFRASALRRAIEQAVTHSFEAR